MPDTLKDRVALVTGAAGTMGLAAARLLLEDGCKLAMVDVNRQRNEALAAELGPRACAFSFDISDQQAVQAGHESVVRALGPVDILVNNAGILSNNKAEATDAAEWRRVLGANLDGAFSTTPMITEQLDEAQRQRLPRDIPVGRFCEPEEFAHVVRFLPSPLAGFITGEIIDLNGDLLMD
jgi:3-oxoacyl-[acyl-carrier protein] reductase